MISLFDTWRRHLWLWSLPASFVVLNLLAVAFYHWAFAGQVERLEGRYQSAEERLQKSKDEQVLIQDFLDRMQSLKTEVAGLHRDRFRTEEQRFTHAIQEVKKLARQAGLKPRSLSYPRKSFSGHGLRQRSINFSVKGSYDQLRNFINFLELSEHFLTLNSVTLGGGGDPREPGLGIKLVVSTIFTTRRLPASEGITEAASGEITQTDEQAEGPTS